MAVLAGTLLAVGVTGSNVVIRDSCSRALIDQHEVNRLTCRHLNGSGFDGRLGHDDLDLAIASSAAISSGVAFTPTAVSREPRPSTALRRGIGAGGTDQPGANATIRILERFA